MDAIIVVLLLVIVGLLARINSKLPGGRDLAQEAMERYYQEKAERERQSRKNTL
ncbi:hypothetical protein [Paenibacillus sp.]|uniref:hypothetical protein n=1 Tax=Paenibacillus sp. TaxID=58172 RepID=UPI002D6D5D54|nr:hypothetical protein [Paenibacillus sp.]HZG86892.1 hypothetical protein [Paenibacillus sp.]